MELMKSWLSAEKGSLHYGVHECINSCNNFAPCESLGTGWVKWEEGVEVPKGVVDTLLNAHADGDVPVSEGDWCGLDANTLGWGVSTAPKAIAYYRIVECMDHATITEAMDCLKSGGWAKQWGVKAEINGAGELTVGGCSLEYTDAALSGWQAGGAELYKIPTDTDALARPQVQVRDLPTQQWKDGRTLIYVSEGQLHNYCTVDDNAQHHLNKYCRIAVTEETEGYVATEETGTVVISTPCCINCRYFECGETEEFCGIEYVSDISGEHESFTAAHARLSEHMCGHAGTEFERRA